MQQHREKQRENGASSTRTLLHYFKKKGREDEEYANTGDSQPAGVKKAKKDKDFKPA